MEPDVTVRKIIIEQEIAAWNNALYQARLRYRVHEQIGATSDVLEVYKRDVERALSALDVCHLVLAEVEAEMISRNGSEISHVNAP